jgi:hypothetical protein
LQKLQNLVSILKVSSQYGHNRIEFWQNLQKFEPLLRSLSQYGHIKEVILTGGKCLKKPLWKRQKSDPITA